MKPAFKKSFELMRDNNFNLLVKTKVLKDKIGDVNEELLDTSKKKLLENTGDEEKNKSILQRMRLQQKN